jgi:hypothetical protein
MGARRMIKIENIHIENLGKKSRLVFDYSINLKPSQVWFEVDSEYEEYLCTERCDAFIIGILPFAMKNGFDIISDVPITEELLYKLNENLIPLLSKYDKHLSHIKITAPKTNEILQNAGAVGTGVSGGTDSFNTIISCLNSPYKDFKLTHLCIFNVGSFGGNGNYRKDIRNKVIERGKIIAKEYNLPLIISNSNLADIFPRNHEYAHDFSSVFAICCLQKLWKVYLYASSCTDLNVFSLINSSKNDSDEYSLLLHYCFNNKNIHIVSEGMDKDRLEKQEMISESPVAQKYLHVCPDEADNCSKCSKCMRTMLAFDAIGKLENFSNVFDVEYYKKHKSKYYWFLYEQHYKKTPMLEPIYQAIKPKIPLLQQIFYKTGIWLKHFIYDETYPERKTFIRIRICGIPFKFRRS